MKNSATTLAKLALRRRTILLARIEKAESALKVAQDKLPAMRDELAELDKLVDRWGPPKPTPEQAAAESKVWTREKAEVECVRLNASFNTLNGMIEFYVGDAPEFNVCRRPARSTRSDDETPKEAL